MTKDHGGHVHILVLVHDDGDPFAVVHHADHVVIRFYFDLYCVHLRVALLVVSRVHQNFVENLVKYNKLHYQVAIFRYAC